MLDRLRLRNFKSFAEAEVPLTNFTLLIGANAAGKSNVFDAVRLLQGLASDYGIADILRGRWEGGKEVWQGLRGGAAELARAGHHQCTLESSWSIDNKRFSHLVELDSGDHPHLVREKLISPGHGDYLFDTHAKTLGAGTGVGPGGALSVAIRAEGGGRNISTQYHSSRSLVGQIKPQSRLHQDVLPLLNTFVSHVADVRFLSITPSRMRDYSVSEAEELGASGENISGVLYQLSQDPRTKADVVDWLADLCAPELEELGFVETSLRDVMVEFIEADGTKISARSLSDGTLRFLGELVALLTAPEGSVLLLEEIENGLHPARIGLLVELYEKVTQARSVQVVATTHSPTLLRALSSRTLKNAVVFARDSSLDGSVAKRLGDLPNFEEVLSRRGIEYLFTTQWLERAL